MLWGLLPVCCVVAPVFGCSLLFSSRELAKRPMAVLPCIVADVALIVLIRWMVRTDPLGGGAFNTALGNGATAIMVIALMSAVLAAFRCSMRYEPGWWMPRRPRRGAHARDDGSVVDAEAVE